MQIGQEILRRQKEINLCRKYSMSISQFCMAHACLITSLKKSYTLFHDVWIRNQLDVTFVLSFNMFWATMCPSSGADNCIMLSPRVGIVPWLQEGCQDRSAGSVFIEEFVARSATNSSMDIMPY